MQKAKNTHDLKIGKHLRAFRKSRRLDQKEIAKMLNITRQAYSNYELGKRTLNVNIMIKLADFYDISLDELIGRKR